MMYMLNIIPVVVTTAGYYHLLSFVYITIASVFSLRLDIILMY